MRKYLVTIAAVSLILVGVAGATHESFEYDPPPESGSVAYDAPAVQVPFSVDPPEQCVDPPAASAAIGGADVSVNVQPICINPAPINGSSAYDAASVQVPYTHDPPPRQVAIPDTAPPPPPPPPPPAEWGTFSSTLKIWPSGAWRPFADSSPFNKPIPANPTLRSNSAAIVSRLTTGPGSLSAGIPNTQDYYHSVVYSRPTDPLYTIHCTPYTCDDLEGKQIRIPVGTRPPGGGDGHISVVDQASGFIYDLYDASVPSGTGGTLNVGEGGVTRAVDPNATGISLDLDGDGRLAGATAGYFSGLAAIIRAEELQAGQINHALFMTHACSSPSPRNVPPAPRPIGTPCGDNIDRMPMGTRLQLNMTPAEIDALAVPAWKKTILRAMATYGLYFGDTGGPSAFGVWLESCQTYVPFGEPCRMVSFAQANGWTLSGGYYHGDLRSGVPWNRLRVLDWNDPANH